MQKDYQYMVDFTLPESFTEDFMEKIPHQRAKVNRLFREGKIVNYALSIDNLKMWAVVNADSVEEVEELMASLPLTKYMVSSVSMLTFYNGVEEEIPAFSLN